MPMRVRVKAIGFWITGSDPLFVNIAVNQLMGHGRDGIGRGHFRPAEIFDIGGVGPPEVAAKMWPGIILKIDPDHIEVRQQRHHIAPAIDRSPFQKMPPTV